MQIENTGLFRVGRGKSELSFDYILKVDNNWEQFKVIYGDELRPVVVKEVEKMLLCRDPKAGFATYICTSCGETKVLPFSCNSRLCSRCGKKYADIWSEELSEYLLPCVHRHIVLTISDRLWCYFINNSKLQKVLLDEAAKTMKEVLNLSNKEKKRLKCGEIVVLHPFGDDLKANFHVHILISEGGLDEEGKWYSTIYLDYEIIRKKWQYNILTALKKESGLRDKTPPLNVLDLSSRGFSKVYPLGLGGSTLLGKRGLIEIIDWCFKYRKNGFYIFAKRRLPPVTNRKGTIRYIGRYVRHPAISNRRIIRYDGKTVTFTYEEGRKRFEKNIPKFEFIKLVLQHVTERQFKVVRRYGLYARRGSESYRASYLAWRQTGKALAGEEVSEVSTVSRFNWRENVKRYTGEDPLSCPRCGNEMDLYQLTYPDGYGGYKTVGGLNWLFRRGVLIEDVLEERSQEDYARWEEGAEVYLS